MENIGKPTILMGKSTTKSYVKLQEGRVSFPPTVSCRLGDGQRLCGHCLADDALAGDRKVRWRLRGSLAVVFELASKILHA